MLLESTLCDKYVEYLKSKQIQFEYEPRIYNGSIDFKVELEGKIVGIELKADRSNIFSAIGQLMNAKRTFSDVYLLSTENFYHKIREIMSELGIQDQFGFIVFKEGEFITLSEPKVKGHYFNEKYYKPCKEKKTKTLVLDKDILYFLERHKDSPFFCYDLATEMKISMPHAQSKINKWKRFGLVEEISHIGLPKPFKIVRIPKEHTNQ
jgi:hypothetical protein